MSTFFEKFDVESPSTRVESSYNKRDVLYQGFASLVAFSLVIQAGINLALSTVLHPQLAITDEEASWVASLGAIGTPIGSLSTGFLMDRIGRQKTLLATAAVSIVSWSVLCLSPAEMDIKYVYLTRLLEGLGCGMSSIAIVYVAETTDKNWRPFFLSINSIALSGGILLTTTMGVILTWRAFALFCLGISTTSALLSLTLPESPSWLVRYDPELAKKALARFFTDPQVFEAEWQLLEPKELKISKTRNRLSLQKKIVHPLGVVLILITLQQLVGIYPTIFYSLELFQKINKRALTSATNDSYQETTTMIPSMPYNATTLDWMEHDEVFEMNAFKNKTDHPHNLEDSDAGAFKLETGHQLNMSAFMNETGHHSDLNSDEISMQIKSKLDLESHAVRALMGLGFIRFMASVSMTVLSKHLGVRTLLMCSSFGVALTAALFSGYQAGWCSQSSDIVSITIVLAFITFGSLGLLVIPWTLVGELLPFEFRGVGQGIVVAYAYVVMSVIVKSYPSLEGELGTSVVFGFFSAVAFLTIAFVYFFVPETLGRTMDEIQGAFQKR